jgi:anaerobic carbon-monoxide dehydrogenase iron sulfur subunit
MKKLFFYIEKCLACRTCEMVCCVGHSLNKDLFKDVRENSISPARLKIFSAKAKNYPLACRHCDDPKCVVACMSAALKKDEKTGQVLHDKDKCVGCWMCVMACPYGAIRLDRKEKIPLRCDLCIDIGEPRCAKNCPVKAIIWEEEAEIAKKK